MWTGGLPHLSGLPHLPGVSHLHVSGSLVMIRTAADIDLAVLAVASVPNFDMKGFWMCYATLFGHLFSKALGLDSKCLPVFHTLTRCDTTPFFAGHLKRTARFSS